MDDFVAYDLEIFFNKDFFGLNPSSADNKPLYSVPLLMNHGVILKKQDVKTLSLILSLNNLYLFLSIFVDFRWTQKWSEVERTRTYNNSLNLTTVYCACHFTSFGGYTLVQCNYASFLKAVETLLFNALKRLFAGNLFHYRSVIFFSNFHWKCKNNAKIYGFAARVLTMLHEIAILLKSLKICILLKPCFTTGCSWKF